MDHSSEIRPFPTITKDEEMLRYQWDKAEELAGITLVPPTQGRNGEIGEPWKNLKENFPEVADAYLQLVREMGAREARAKGLNVQTMDQRDLWRLRSTLFSFNIQHNLNRRAATDLSSETAVVNKELQDWQLEVYEAITNFMNQRMNSGLQPEGAVQLPTGTGKTVIFSDLVTASGFKSLIVVPNEVLLEQTYNELKQISSSRGVELDIGRFYGGEKSHRIGKNVTIAIYNSLSNDAQKEQSELQNAGFGLVILDEAHRGLSEARKDAISKFTTAVKIGFTATPKFSDEKQVGHLVGADIYKMTVKEAVDRDLLARPAPPRYIRTSVSLGNVGVSRKDGIEDYNETDLANTINIRGRNLAAVKYYKEAEDINGKTAVAYCVGVQHAKDLAEEFNNQGISAAVISGETSSDERRDIFDKYKKGEIQVLCNANLLIEGFDEPKASVCLNLRPTKSWVVAEQRAGRVLRKDRNNPDKYATFVEFIDEYDEKDPNRPVLVRDIYEGAFISREAWRDRIGSRSTGFSEKEEGEHLNMGDSVEVAYFTEYEDALHFTSVKKEAEGNSSSPWVTEEEVQDLFGMTDMDRWKSFFVAKLGYNPNKQRERFQSTGEKVTEHHLSVYEEAFLIHILPVLEELNERMYVDQKRIITLPKFYLYFRNALQSSDQVSTVKSFLMIMADKRKGGMDNIQTVSDQLENTNLMRGFRNFQNTFSPRDGHQEYMDAKKHTVYLLDIAENSQETESFAA